MKDRTIKISAIALGLLMTTAIVASGASAYQGNPDIQGPNYSPERHEKMTQAFENNDYESWKNTMTENKRHGRIMNIVNEDNFAKFSEMRQLRIDGDTEGANAIRAELGLGQGQMRRAGAKGNHRSGSNGSERGQNSGGGFIDVDGDGDCDNL